MIVLLEFESSDERIQADTIREQLNAIYPEFVISVQRREQDPEPWEE